MVGFVAIQAATSAVDDVIFYLTAKLILFYVYSGVEIFLWDAIHFIEFYLFLVGFVFG